MLDYDNRAMEAQEAAENAAYAEYVEDKVAKLMARSNPHCFGEADVRIALDPNSDTHAPCGCVDWDTVFDLGAGHVGCAIIVLGGDEPCHMHGGPA